MRKLAAIAGILWAAATCSQAEERLYYVAVDTASQQVVEEALHGLQQRYGIKYGAMGSSLPAAPTASSTTASPASATPFVLKIDKKTRASGRVPKTEQEFHELTVAARESPAACYAWIYGKDNPLVQQLKGRSWSELGDDDGIQQCRAESSRVRASKSFLGL